ncbi:hypothetical protein WMY93_013649 [Mugilogobius chulae]|uniref:Uncharacterized protein n=1 Tax=Mugilogobius chulae TaxID=88201 RepID=A0AAW0P0N0_9GOBI
MTFRGTHRLSGSSAQSRFPQSSAQKKCVCAQRRPICHCPTESSWARVKCGNLRPAPTKRQNGSDSDLDLQDSIKEQLFGCKLHTLEKKCCSKLDKLKALLEQHTQTGLSLSELLDKTLSLFTLRKTILLHNGYSKYSRDILRLFPDAEEDLCPLLL